MSCGLFDLPCHIGAVLAPWLFWLEVAGVAIVVIVGLWVLSKIKEIGGWPAVGAALVGLAAAGGYIAGRRHPHEAAPEQPYVLSKADIEALQQALHDRGLYPEEPDGRWGPKTKTAVSILQHTIGEQQTGTLTPRVRKALGLRF